MSKGRFLLIVLVGMPFLAFLLMWIFYKIYLENSYEAHWNQKTSVIVQTPTGVVEGASVVNIFFERGNEKLLRAGPSSGVKWSVTGEAVVVDLGGGKYLFALLQGTGPNASFVFRDSKRDATGSIAAIKNVEANEGAPAKPIPPEYYPLLVTFRDINDPASVEKVDPDDLAATFGPGYALKSISLAITGEPVTTGKVEKVLGWIIEAGYLIPPSQQPRYVKDQTIEQRISPGDFIDWRTRKEKRESQE